MSEDSRVVWADYAKVICIYFVTLVHTPIFEPVSKIIYIFLIPSFFFLSGYFFSFDRYPEYKMFLRKRVRQLVVPYVFLALTAYLFWLVLARHFGDDTENMMTWYTPLLGITFGYSKLMAQATPLWFIISLFVAENLNWLLGRYLIRNRWILIMLVVVLGLLNIKYLHFPLPYQFNAALSGLPFYIMGGIIRDMKSFKYMDILFVISGIILILGAYLLNSDIVRMHVDQYGNYLLFLSGALGGVLFVYSFCRILARYIGKIRFLLFLGRNTIVICGLHLVMFTLLKGVMVYILGISLDVLDGTVIPCLIFGIFSILCCVPVIYVLERYFPYLLGRVKI